MADPQQLYQKTAQEYKKFFDKVHESFIRHCEEIKSKTNAALDATADSDAEARQKILANQKKELDSSLSELKQLLDQKGREARIKLEDIVKNQENSAMDLEKELETAYSTK